MDCSEARAKIALTFASPSIIEKSLWTLRCTNLGSEIEVADEIKASDISSIILISGTK
ncbi:hypothetical protein GCM10009128_17430 [Psychrosphaera haliotis]